ncbi:MAG: alpha/beta fold hydrolase [Pseudomonadota bacterium]
MSSRPYLLVFAILCLSACVSFPDAPPATVQPLLLEDQFIAADGTRLGLQQWEANEPRAVIVALHGMNDYSEAFAGPAAWWAAEAGITTYAIDQRGFGRSPQFGRWVGRETLKADLRAAIDAARTAHPATPVFALGHSMGGAIILAAEADARLNADGIILAAPAVWGGPALPVLYRISANIAAFFAPGKTLTGERAGRQSTDNIEALRAMAVDERVIKETRIDAVLGVTRAMGEGYRATEDVEADVLLLIGEKDEIIPIKTMANAADRIRRVSVVRYDDGWHLLFRDLQRERVWRDVADWITDRSASSF